MFVPIFIDTSAITDEFFLSKKQVIDMQDSIVKHLTMRLYEKWVEAARSLKSSRIQYAESLLVVDEGKLKGAVVLTGVVPNMIEQGVSSFDLKKGFESSTKKKIAKDGSWYLTIPLRMATPGALGESSVFSGVMPQEVYSVIKNKENIPGTTKAVLTPSEIPSQYAIPKQRGEFSDIVNKTQSAFAAYEHKSSIYAGLQKTGKQYESANQSTYTSFRRVSSKSDKNSWIHTGIAARNLAEKALSQLNIEHEVDVQTDNYLSTLGF